MSRNIKAPPSLSSCSSYEVWLKELKIWQIFTDLAKSKQGPAIFLTLEGRSREAVLELEPEKIGADDGVATIIEKLDSLFLKDKTQSAFEAYDAFEKFRRPHDMSINDYIIEFERLMEKTKTYKTTMSTDILAYRLLKSANLTESHEQLARATAPELKYESVKKQLKKIFGDSPSECDKDQDFSSNVKDEIFYESTGSDEAYYGSYNQGSRGGRRLYRQPTTSQNRGRGFVRGTQMSRRGQNATRRGKNPLNDKGEYSRCVICESINHWAVDCPDAIYFSEFYQYPRI